MMISQITDKIIPKAIEWQNRPLHTVYPIVFIDCVYYNVKSDNMVSKKTTKFWLSVLTDLKTRGVKDILIVCSDGLTGLKQAIESAFPSSIQQRCIVHLIRNLCKYLSYKDRKEFCNDLKKVYRAPNEATALSNLDECEEKWKDKYPYAFKPWRDNWNE